MLVLPARKSTYISMGINTGACCRGDLGHQLDQKISQRTGLRVSARSRRPISSGICVFPALANLGEEGEFVEAATLQKVKCFLVLSKKKEKKRELKNECEHTSRTQKRHANNS